ncbi:MAG: hypothetical protein OEY14_03880 [Myxococcales bacterium]|nr:hypothetical protein [Myxococcales bacterium]
MEKQRRRNERESARQEREFRRQIQTNMKAAEEERARWAVDHFVATLNAISSMHREAGDWVDWTAVLNKRSPEAPMRPPPPSAHEVEQAKAKLANHRPGLLERWGLSKATRRLEEALAVAVSRHVQAQQSEDSAHERALLRWKEQTARDEEERSTAQAILSGDVDVRSQMVDALNPFAELLARHGRVAVEMEPTRARIRLSLDQDDIVPFEELSLTARGKLSRKKMATSKRLAIYQDYVCGAALRASRELMAILPMHQVVTDVYTDMLDSATGHMVVKPILSVCIPHEVLGNINWNRADASDLVERLLHRMRFHKTKGFSPVAAMDMPSED